MSFTTRAAVLSRTGAARPYADSRPLSVETVTLDPPGPGEVRVAIKAAGLCHSDVGYLDGTLTYALAFTPIALGHEIAGVVSDVACRTGETVSAGKRLVLIEPAG